MNLYYVFDIEQRALDAEAYICKAGGVPFVGRNAKTGELQPNKTKTERWAIPQQRLSDGKWIFPVVPDELVARCDQSVISVFHEAYPHVKEEYDPTWFMEPVISGGPAISGGQ